MATAPIDGRTTARPLRLWPGVVLVALQWFLRFPLPVLVPEAMLVAIFGALFCFVAIVLWWAFFSRAPHLERWGAIALMVAGYFLTPRFLHPSIVNGMMGMMFTIYLIPVLSLALVAWAVATRHLAAGPRRLAMVAALLLAFAGWTLVRTAGMTGNGDSDFAWRWTPTAEDRLLAQVAQEPPVLPPAPAVEPAQEPTVEPPVEPAPVPAVIPATPAERLVEPVVAEPAALAAVPAAPAAVPHWSGFRGSERNSLVPGARVATDWAASPPVELWRRPVGPGWSSFAVHGDFFYTQEQRGEDEVVACYRVATGEPVWLHGDPTRFWESNAGAGPRGTPTLHDGRVFTLGATGLVNALDADDGAVLWSRDAATDTGAKLPDWGFSSSPLVVGDLVLVAASGSLVAYDLATGEPRWFGPAGGASYSSPQWTSIDGVAQVLLLDKAGLTSVDPAAGTVLWQHAWAGYPIVQPALTASGDVLIAVNSESGTRRLAITHQPTGWTVNERWTSSQLKPYFNDFVVHEGHAYGFDGRILGCIDVEDGKRKWKGGRYGNGQLVLLPDQDVLLVLSEQGELALVRAIPDAFEELARFPAIEGKTWNHPVLAGDVVLVRNDQEMAAFRLSRGED